MIEVLLLPFFVLLTCFTAIMFLFILFVDKKLCYLCLSHWHGAIDNFLFVRVKVSHSDNLKIKYFVNNLRCMFVVNIFFYHCFQNLYYPSDLKMLLYGSTNFYYFVKKRKTLVKCSLAKFSLFFKVLLHKFVLVHLCASLDVSLWIFYLKDLK